MIKWLTDEDFDNRILRGLRLQLPAIDILRVQDVGLAEANDPQILEWAAQNQRVLLTHDRRTMPRHVKERLNAGLSIFGVVVVPQSQPIGDAIEDISICNESVSPDELFNQVWYLPL
jgi:hypothetical protein